MKGTSYSDRENIQETWWTFGHPLWRSPIVKWDRDSDEDEGAENGIEGGGSAESDGSEEAGRRRQIICPAVAFSYLPSPTSPNSKAEFESKGHTLVVRVRTPAIHGHVPIPGRTTQIMFANNLGLP